MAPHSPAPRCSTGRGGVDNRAPGELISARVSPPTPQGIDYGFAQASQWFGKGGLAAAPTDVSQS
jgi:hypothetical protein